MTLSQLKCLAQNGNIEAQIILAERYDDGDGVEADPAESARWYLKASECGDAYAQWILGRRFSCGDGVKESGSEAIKWYTRSAQSGNSHAMFDLGHMYSEGSDRENPIEACKWYLLNLALMLVRGPERERKILVIARKAWEFSESQIQEAEGRAREFLKRLPAEARKEAESGFEKMGRLRIKRS